MNNISNRTLNEIEKEIKQSPNLISKESQDYLSFISKLNENDSISKKMKSDHLKTFNLLNKMKAEIKNKIIQLHNNEDIFVNESYLNVNSSKVNDNVRKFHIKQIKEKEKSLLHQFNDINIQIENVLKEEKLLDKEKNLRYFLEKYENENEEIKFQKYINNIIEKCYISRQNRLKELEKSQKKYIQKLNEIEEVEKEKKIQNLEEKREIEKNLIKKRLKNYNEKYNKLSYLIRTSTSRNKSYLYNKIKNKYEKESNNFFSKSLSERKIKINSAIENLDIHKKNYDEILLNLQKEKNEMTKNLKQFWKNRSKIIPDYKNPLFKLINEEENKQKEYIQNKKMKIMNYHKEMKNYSNKKVKMPKLSRGDNEIIRLINKKNLSGIYNEQKNKKMFHNCQNINQKTIKENKKINNSFSCSQIDLNTNLKVKEILNKSPKKKLFPIIFKNHSFSNSSSNKNIKDYLSEIRKQNNLIITKNNIKQIENENINFNELRTLKNKIDTINNKLQKEKELIKIKGGYDKNPNAAFNINELQIDSIKNKMEIIYMLKKQN